MISQKRLTRYSDNENYSQIIYSMSLIATNMTDPYFLSATLQTVISKNKVIFE